MQNEFDLNTNKICQICKIKIGSNKCPDCERRSCGLKCFQKHKELFKCLGCLRRTKYIKKKEMNLKTLKRDKFFLSNEINRSNHVSIIQKILFFRN